MGVFGSLWDVGHASGPILTGILLTKVDYLPAFGAISVILLIATVLFQFYVKETNRSTS
jgi:predicted MFS family arabinose efflux permease